MILISVQELQKSFGVHEVLRSVTFSLQKGETLILSDSSGNILGSVDVPELGSGFVYSLQDYGEYRVVSE